MVQAITSSCYDNDSWRMAIINEIGMDDGSSLKADPARPGDVKIAVVITAVNFLTLYFSYSHWQLVGCAAMVMNGIKPWRKCAALIHDNSFKSQNIGFRVLGFCSWKMTGITEFSGITRLDLCRES